MQIPEMEQNDPKKFLVLKIIALSLGARNSHSSEQDLCHWQSMCYKTRLRFNISLGDIFPKAAPLIVTKKYDESVLMQISQEFRTLKHVNCHRNFRNCIF